MSSTSSKWFARFDSPVFFPVDQIKQSVYISKPCTLDEVWESIQCEIHAVLAEVLLFSHLRKHATSCSVVFASSGRKFSAPTVTNSFFKHASLTRNFFVLYPPFSNQHFSGLSSSGTPCTYAFSVHWFPYCFCYIALQ